MTTQKMDSRTNPVQASETPSAMTVAQIDQALRDFVLQDTAHLRRDAETASQGASRRMALAVNSGDELPRDPETTTQERPRGPRSVSAKIDPNPKPPVLADGLFVHTERPAPGSFHEADIRLPNINCDKCTLQIIQRTRSQFGWRLQLPPLRRH